MKLHTTLMASCALAVMGTTAMADCAADLALLNPGAAGGGQTGGISKDGSLAPLEMPDAAAGSGTAVSPTTGGSTGATGDVAGDNAAAASSDAAVPDETTAVGDAGSEGIAKDGSLAPLEGTEGEAKTPIAMSGQDVQAQQAGEPTAAEIASDSASSTETTGATTTGSGEAASDGAQGAASATADATGSGASAEGATTGARDRSAVIAEAQAALDAGDEEACLAAIEKIEAL